MTPAVEISYLKPEEQTLLVETMESEQATPSLSQAQRMKKLSQEGKLTEGTMLSVMSEQKKPEAERIEAGVVGYEEALLDSFPRDPRMKSRLHTAVQLFRGSLWLNEIHRQRMEVLKAREGYRRRRDTPAYFAAMYLLTADPDTAKRTANCFCRDGIMFGYATTKDISPHGYTLLSAARDIYANGDGVALTDLADGEVIDTEAFCLIVNALLIACYGCAALEIQQRERLGH